MFYFNSDYTEGAHERILRRFQETNMEQTAGYGEDAYCMQAAEKIREAVASRRGKSAAVEEVLNRFVRRISSLKTFLFRLNLFLFAKKSLPAFVGYETGPAP